MPGTPDTPNAKHGDELFDAAMAELAAEGSQTPPSVDGSAQEDAQDATGANPSVQNVELSSPATPGAAETPAQTIDAAQNTPIDDDPLAGAEPVSITVDGQSRALEGFTRIPGQGIIIDEEKVPVFQLMASRAETLERQNRDLYQRTQEYERLSEWKTKGPDGTDTTLTGRDALEARDVELASTKAFSAVVEQALLNPKLFASLVTVDGQGQIVPDLQQLQFLATRAQLASRDAMDAAKSRFSSTIQTTTQAQQQAQLSEQAPTLLWQTASQVWGKEFPQLTGEDKTFLSSQVPRYMRTATPAEVQAGQFKPGEPVLDPSFYTVMQDRAALRGQLASVATASSQANKFNAGQNQGRKQNAPPPKSSPSTPATPEPKKRPDEQWDDVFNTAMREVTA